MTDLGLYSGINGTMKLCLKHNRCVEWSVYCVELNFCGFILLFVHISRGIKKKKKEEFFS